MEIQLDNIFHSLSDKTRRDILLRLSHQQLSVSEIAEPYKISLAAISKHLKVLERAKMIIRNREGKKFMLISNPAGIKIAESWVNKYKAELNSNFDRMDEYLTKLQKGEKTYDRK